jgi:hypothetical protein
LRRSFRPRHVHIAHPYQRDLQLILEPPVYHPSISWSVAFISTKLCQHIFLFPDSLRFPSIDCSVQLLGCLAG